MTKPAEVHKNTQAVDLKAPEGLEKLGYKNEPKTSVICTEMNRRGDTVGMAQERIQIIGLTEVQCRGYDVPGAEHEGCTTIQVTFVDRTTLKVQQFAVGDDVRSDRVEDLLAHISKLVGSPITAEDIRPDPRKYSFDTAWMPLPAK